MSVQLGLDLVSEALLLLLGALGRAVGTTFTGVITWLGRSSSLSCGMGRVFLIQET